jgi:hypothetical protein
MTSIGGHTQHLWLVAVLKQHLGCRCNCTLLVRGALWLALWQYDPRLFVSFVLFFRCQHALYTACYSQPC